MNNMLLATRKTTKKFSTISIALVSLYLPMNTLNVQASEMTTDEQKCVETAIDNTDKSEKSKSLLQAWNESGSSCQERDEKIYTEYIFHTMRSININRCLSSRMINDFTSVPAIQMQMLDIVEKELKANACSR